MMLTVYRMNEDVVYSSSVPSCPFWWMSSSKTEVPDPILGVSRWLVVALVWFVVLSQWSKIGLQKFLVAPKFEVRMMLTVYRMNEDVVFSSSVPSCPFWWKSSFKTKVPYPILMVEVVFCSILVVRGIVQVVQNWFIGIPNPSRSSMLGRVSQVFIGWVRTESFRRVFQFPSSVPFFWGV